MTTLQVQVPDIGDFDEVTVIELLVKIGDTVKVDQSLITVESDKASMEIPSSAEGIVKDIKVSLGDQVREGSVVLVLETAGEVAASTSHVPEQSQPAAPLPAPADASVPTATPFPALTATIAEQTAPAPTSTPSTGSFQIHMPDIGDFKDVTVIEVLAKPGDHIKLEQSLITVESDKASMEIPSSHSGVLKEIYAKIGDKLNIGDLLASVGGADTDAAALTSAVANVATPSISVAPSNALTNAALVSAATALAPTAAVASTAQVASTPVSAADAKAVPSMGMQALPHEPAALPMDLPHASPSVRKFARELGVPLAEVKGTGDKGRITQEDVQTFTSAVMSGATATKAQEVKLYGGAAVATTATTTAAAAASGAGDGLNLLPWPKVDFTKFGEIERKDRSRIKKISAANLHRNWVMIPHVTNHDDCDITELEAFRVSLNKENEKSGVKLTMLAFMIKASVAALKQFPEFNSSLDGEQLVLKKYYHIGFAADTPNGLVVPVIKDADKKGVMQISTEMGELAKKARDGKLGPADMSGACFTISSLGGIGGRYFTPIINAPEVAIMGVCKSQLEPKWDGKQFTPKLMLPLSLSWDHCVIDGASAARFNSFFGQMLTDFRRVML